MNCSTPEGYREVGMKSKFRGKWIVVQVEVWISNSAMNHVQLLAVFLSFFSP